MGQPQAGTTAMMPPMLAILARSPGAMVALWGTPDGSAWLVGLLHMVGRGHNIDCLEASPAFSWSTCVPEPRGL